jgi:cytochrome c-type biogenesis protein
VSLVGLVTDGPLLLATPVAAAAGVLSFFSPCVLPLVPGYLSYVTGLSGADLEGESRAARKREAKAATAAPAGAVTEAVPAGARAEAVLVPAGAGTGAAGQPSVAGGTLGLAGDRAASAGEAAGSALDCGSALAARRVVGAPAAGAGVPPRTGAWLLRAGLSRVRRVGRVTAGTGLFVLGFAIPLVSWGAAFGGAGQWLAIHQIGISRILGAVTILMGLLFAGTFSRFMWANREFRFHRLPAPGLLGAPLLGVLFGLGWTPCLGPTLAAVQGLAMQSATAGRGAFLSAMYCLGLGVPFLVVGLAFRRTAGALAVVRSHARLVTLAGGALLVAVGILQVTGQWADLVATLRSYAPGFAETPL